VEQKEEQVIHMALTDHLVVKDLEKNKFNLCIELIQSNK